MSENNDISILYSKVNKIDVRLKGLEETRPFLLEMIERNIKSNEELSKTMQEVQLTMTKMNDKMDEQYRSIEQIKEDFEKATKDTNEKIDGVDKRIQELEDKHQEESKEIESKMNKLEDKGKFDILEFFRKNFPWIIVCVGLGIAYASTIVKFF